MANKKSKTDKKLQRRIEALKAQLKVDNPKQMEISMSSVDDSNGSPELLDTSNIKKDILKTLFLSLLAFATILFIWKFGALF